jgi:hypothetical protein
MLREYGVRFGRVERTLYRETQKGADANRRKSDYLVRFAITARQFNAVRIQLQGVVVLVEGLPTDPSGASSAWAVASRLRGKHTGVSVCPDVVCYLTLHGATQHANRFQPLFGKRGGIKCHISGTAGAIGWLSSSSLGSQRLDLSNT